jgi:alpha-beta hydrolase superfamily lysophospholipase
MTSPKPPRSDAAVRDFTGPPGLRTRGTVLVIAGRGETPDSYARFAARLAADAYRVRVLPAPVIDPTDVPRSLHAFAAALDDAVASIADRADPLVLAGADTGAAALGALLAQPQPLAAWWPDAVLLAGLPGYDARPRLDWDDELDARTHCPVHRGVLTDDAAIQPGALATAVPSGLLDAAYGSTAEPPHLLLVGDADPLADRAALGRLAKGLPAVRLSVVRGAHHDVLNDLQHRAVAAHVVTYLEALRGTPRLAPIVETETSTW